MPWNDNANPGPWGSPPPSGGKGPSDEGPKRPRGPGPRRPSGPPDLDELQQRVRERVQGLFGGSGGDMSPRRMIPAFAGALVALYFASGIIVVGAKEEAVVTTFGAWTRGYGPGLGYHLPLFEASRKIDITTLRKTEIGGETGAADTLMLTGDENIVDLSFSVTWRVSNPGWYLFNIDRPDETVKAVAESAMREVIGRTAFDPIISSGRGQVEIQVAELTQRILDRYRSGIIIDAVQLNDPSAPKEVIDAFRDVNNASQNAASRANQARGTAAQVVQQAKGYQSQVVREAAGEAARFNQVYEQYRLAPGVTRDRLYIETMERVLSRSNKVIIDSKGASAPIILPPDVFRPRTQPSTTTTLTPLAPAQGDGQ